MYIDYLKQDYKDKSEDERKLYIERDKKCIGSIIREKIANDIDNIVERYYEFDDIGYIDINEKFLELLKEAEQLYYFGYYVGTIALVGITAGSPQFKSNTVISLKCSVFISISPM